MEEFNGRGNADVWYLSSSACYMTVPWMSGWLAVGSGVGVKEALGGLIWACETEHRPLSTRPGVSYMGQDDVIDFSVTWARGCAAGANETEVDDEIRIM